MIDGDPKDYEEYYQKLDIVDQYGNDEAFRLGQMYDPKNVGSLISGLELANDNAIVLREEIKSESLSYIQMSLCHIKQCADRREKNITVLQPITDYLLAFFGSIDERVFDERLRNLFDIKIFVEADADERILRRVLRDMNERGRDLENIISQYLTTVKPMHYLYVEPTKNLADIVINSGLNDVAFDIMKTKIQDILANAES